MVGASLHPGGGMRRAEMEKWSWTFDTGLAAVAIFVDADVDGIDGNSRMAFRSLVK